jgi:hypothetical protein
VLIRTGSRSRPVPWTLLPPLLAVGLLYASGFGGWWLGDDLANLHQLHAWAEQGRSWPETWAKFAGAVDARGAFYRPLMMLALALNHAWAGAEYPSWFAVNLALHLANTLLVGLLAHRLASHCACDARLAAPLAAAWFGLHPMLAEGVYWLSARADAAVVLLTLLALSLWSGRPGARPTLRALLLPVLLALALGFKESAAVFPLQLALVWLAWPQRTTHAQRVALVVAFGVTVAFLLWRAWLFGSAWQVYRSDASPALGGALASLPAWWLALSAPARVVGLAFLGASLVALGIATVAARGAQARLVLALLAASGGMALATLLNLGALSAAGEGGRLGYAPLAWLAIAIGVGLARGRRAFGRTGRTDRAAPVGTAMLFVAAGLGAVVLYGELRAVRAAQDELRAIAAAVPAWAEQHHGLTMLLVPERHGPVVSGRNAQGALVLPPVQQQGLLHRVLPTLPAELAERRGQLEAGLARRLDTVRPQWIDQRVLASLLLNAAERPPERVACWSRRLRRIVALDIPWGERAAWLAQTEAAANQCLAPDAG